MFQTIYKNRLDIIKKWILPISLLTVIFVTILVSAKSIIRNQADEELYTKGVNYRTSLQSGQPSRQLKDLEPVDPYESFSPIVILYDINQNVLGSNITKSRNIPQIPSGVLDYTRVNQINNVTWEPDNNIRLSAVIYKVEGKFNGFILIAKNLYYTEARINIVAKYTTIGFILSIIILFFINQIKSEQKELELTETVKEADLSLNTKQIEVFEKIKTDSKVVKNSKPKVVKKSSKKAPVA